MGSEWRKIALADCVAAIIDYRGKTPQKTPYGVPLVTAKIVKGGRIATPDEFIAEANFDEWMRRGLPKPGDVVITTEAPLGEVAQLGPQRVALAQRLICLRGAPGVLDNTFLKFLLQTEDIQRQLIARSTGTTVTGIRQSELRKVMLLLPSFEEQCAIAHILGTLDDKIELNRRMNETLEAMARALFKSWFVDFAPVRAKSEGRDPGLPQEVAALFPDSFVESELGEVPAGWRVESVYLVADVIYGAPFASGIFNSLSLGEPLIRIRDLPNETPGVWTTEVHPKGYKVRAGDIVVGMDGEFRAYLWGGGEGWLNQRVCVFAPKAGHSAAFLRNSISSLLAEVEATETATTVIHLGKGDIDRFRVVVPGERALTAFNALAQPLYDRIVAAKQESRSLAALRDALLPKLISGELRVREAEAVLKEARA